MTDDSDLNEDLSRCYDSILWVEKEVKRLAKRKYDGFSGSLPKWIPYPLKKEFQATRRFLLRWCGQPESPPPCPFCGSKKPTVKKDSWVCSNNNCGATGVFKQKPEASKEIKEFMGARKGLLDNSDGNYFCPVELFDRIDSLNYVYDLFILGEKKGLQAYNGVGAMEVLRGLVQSEMKSEFAGNRSGKLNPLNSCIQILNPKNLEELLTKFEDEDSLLDLYHSTKGPKIDIQEIEVDRERNRIYYTPRNKDKKMIKFSSLRETISRMKSPIKKK